MLVIRSIIVASNNYTSYYKRLGSQNALWTFLILDLYFRGPEDDSKRVEKCRPKIMFYVVKTYVFDWYVVLYIYIYIYIYMFSTNLLILSINNYKN